MDVNLFVIKIFFVVLSAGLGMAASIQSVEESCVLSLVVPRDKIKTSCSIDDKLKRRLNTMETKINIYKQQVLELETQIHKERLLNNDKIMSLEAMLSKVDKLEELDKRLSYVESLQQRESDNYIPKVTSFKHLSESDNFLPSDQSLETTDYQWREYKPVKIDQNKKAAEDKLKLLQELETLKHNINGTGKNLVTKVGAVLKNVSENLSQNKTFSGDLDDIIEGENGSAIGEYIKDEKSNQIQSDQPTKITQMVGSRILVNDTDSNENKDGNSTDYKTEKKESNAIPVRNPLVVQLEETLKKEIEKVLNDQIEEIISLVKKQSDNIENTQNGQTDSMNILSDQHLSDFKFLNDKIESMELSMRSVTQTMETMYSKAEKLQAIPILFEELKKNITNNQMQRSPGVDGSVEEILDEHTKKLRTMDRLSAIFQRSLEHYRNESKTAYSEIERKVSSESNMVKTLQDNIMRNISSLVDEKITEQNITVRRKLRDAENLMKSIEDHNVLMQVSIDNKDRKLRSKVSKLETDIRTTKQDLQNLGLSQNNLRSEQEMLNSKINDLGKNTALQERLESLELEFRLSLTDEWVEYSFSYDTTRTGCFGLQFIKRTGYKNGRYVGAVLCNNNRYKILLSNDLKEKFMNIGDEVGYGEDHCEFVGGKSNNIVTVSKPSYSFTHDRGFTRSNWGIEPHIVLLDFITPSPAWYECSVEIP